MLRHAELKDLTFIYQLIMDGSKHGYFNREYQEKEAAADGLLVELELMITKNIRVNNIIAQAIVYEHLNKPIGFVLLSGGPDNKGNELYMASVAEGYRGKGHGKKMITGVLDQFKGKNKMLFARCAQESETMYQLLLKNGFKYSTTGDEGYRGLTYEL